MYWIATGIETNVRFDGVTFVTLIIATNIISAQFDAVEQE
jgi:hypothetical protein